MNKKDLSAYFAELGKKGGKSKSKKKLDAAKANLLKVASRKHGK